MLMQTRPRRRRTIGRVGGRQRTPGLAGAWLVLAAAPAAGLAIAALVVDNATDPTTTTWMISSTIAVAAFLVWLMVAIRYTVASTRSPERPVFPAQRTSVCGFGLVVLAGVLTTALALGDPFSHVIGRFRFGASDVVDLGLLAAIFLLFVAGGVLLLDALDHRRAERAWRDHL